MQMMWLEIDVGLPRVLRPELPYPRLERHWQMGRVDGCQVDAHVEDNRLSIIPYLMGQFVMAIPPVLLESCENIIGTICNFSGNVGITEMDDVERCETRC